ncbi:YolD-like family protein [Peribacillus muralis]|uniref:YolD-like family protein n=1 Tax=Peribacillus muralis TaxID=264697 RepID=UPI003D01DF44
MSIKDRGKLKWQPAILLPEYVKLLNVVNKDYYRQHKPTLDEYQIAEFENKIHAAMEFSSTIQFTVWEDGFDWDYTGLVHRLDPLTNLIYLELENEKGHIIKIKFQDIVSVEVKE